MLLHFPSYRYSSVIRCCNNFASFDRCYQQQLWSKLATFISSLINMFNVDHLVSFPSYSYSWMFFAQIEPIDNDTREKSVKTSKNKNLSVIRCCNNFASFERRYQQQLWSKLPMFIDSLMNTCNINHFNFFTPIFLLMDVFK